MASIAATSVKFQVAGSLLRQPKKAVPRFSEFKTVSFGQQKYESSSRALKVLCAAKPETVDEGGEFVKNHLQLSEDSKLISKNREDRKIVSDVGGIFDLNKLNPDERQKYLESKWVLCEHCNIVYYRQFVIDNLGACLDCGYPISITSSERLAWILDPSTWSYMDDSMSTVNVLAE